MSLKRKNWFYEEMLFIAGPLTYQEYYDNLDSGSFLPPPYFARLLLRSPIIGLIVIIMVIMIVIGGLMLTGIFGNIPIWVGVTLLITPFLVPAIFWLICFTTSLLLNLIELRHEQKSTSMLATADEPNKVMVVKQEPNLKELEKGNILYELLSKAINISVRLFVNPERALVYYSPFCFFWSCDYEKHPTVRNRLLLSKKSFVILNKKRTVKLRTLELEYGDYKSYPRHKYVIYCPGNNQDPMEAAFVEEQIRVITDALIKENHFIIYHVILFGYRGSQVDGRQSMGRKVKRAGDLVTDIILQIQRLLDQGVQGRDIFLYSWVHNVAPIAAYYFYKKGIPISVFCDRGYTSLSKLIARSPQFESWVKFGLSISRYELNPGAYYEKLPNRLRWYVETKGNTVIGSYASMKNLFKQKRKQLKIDIDAAWLPLLKNKNLSSLVKDEGFRHGINYIDNKDINKKNVITKLLEIEKAIRETNDEDIDKYGERDNHLASAINDCCNLLEGEYAYDALKKAIFELNDARKEFSNRHKYFAPRDMDAVNEVFDLQPNPSKAPNIFFPKATTVGAFAKFVNKNEAPAVLRQAIKAAQFLFLGSNGRMPADCFAYTMNFFPTRFVSLSYKKAKSMEEKRKIESSIFKNFKLFYEGGTNRDGIRKRIEQKEQRITKI